MALRRAGPTGMMWPNLPIWAAGGAGTDNLNLSTKILCIRLYVPESITIKNLYFDVTGINGSLGANEGELRIHPVSTTSNIDVILPDTTTTLSGPHTFTWATGNNSVTLGTAYTVDASANPYVFLALKNTNATPATNYPRVTSSTAVECSPFRSMDVAEAQHGGSNFYDGSSWSAMPARLIFLVTDEDGRIVACSAIAQVTTETTQQIYGADRWGGTVYYLPPVAGMTHLITGVNAILDQNSEDIVECSVAAGTPESHKVLATATRTFGSNMADEQMSFIFDRPVPFRGGFLTVKVTCTNGTGTGDCYLYDVQAVGALGSGKSIADVKRAHYGWHAVQPIPGTSHHTPVAVYYNGSTYTYAGSGGDAKIGVQVPVIAPWAEASVAGGPPRTRSQAAWRR